MNINCNILQNCLVVLTLAIYANGAWADNEKKTITMLSPITCKSWNETLAEARQGKIGAAQSHLIHSFYVNGFMTGLNLSGVTHEDVLADIRGDTVDSWMEQYCKRHPKNDAIDGAQDLFIQILKRIQKQRERMAPAAPESKGEAPK